MRIEYTEQGDKYNLDGECVWDMLYQIPEKVQREFALKNMPINVSFETFVSIMRDSFNWSKVKLIPSVQIAA